jgi:subtilase family serine protease
MPSAFGTAAAGTVLLMAAAAAPAAAVRAVHGPWSSLSPFMREAVDLGRAPASATGRIVVGLGLRNRESLETFLSEVADPTSSRFGHFLTQEEFNALYAPREADEAAVVSHLRQHGLVITERTPNRLLVGATGSIAAIEAAFGVEIHDVRFRGVRHRGAFREPSFPHDLASVVVGVSGLDDLFQRRPHLRYAATSPVPRAALGSNCCHFSPADLAVLYDNTPSVDGTGQTIVIAGAYAWKDSDNAAFATQWGLPSLVAGSGQVCTGAAKSTGCKFSVQNSIEIALDVEYAHGTAPGARVLNYMSATTSVADFTVMYNQIVTDNPGHVVSTSWGACEAGLSTATQQMDDNIFANANAIGQSWFAASGDSGSRDCSGVLGVDNPANSPHVIGVGGTTPQCSAGMTSSSPACAGYGSESGWSGSGGGVSGLFSRPSFQTGCGVPAGPSRLVPDVALEADPSPGNYVVKNGSWYIVGGTSGSAPQWAGFFAQLNQRLGGNGLGNPGARLYGACGTAAYHDVTSGSNGDYAAGPGYDLVTGLGTVDFRAMLPPACSLDVDENGTVEAATDVVYIERTLLGLVPVPPSFRASDPTIPSDAVIAARVAAAGAAFDVDGSGTVEAATDAVYIERTLLGLTPVPPSFRALDPNIPADATIAGAVSRACP